MERQAYWDNVKALLIFLVVLAHYFGTGIVYKGDTEGLWVIGSCIYSFIYLFHMPLFSFISGYFSKKAEACRASAFSKLFLPYLLVNTVFVILDRETVNPILAPYGPMWYLLALFFWRMVLPDMARLKRPWLWGLGISMLFLVLTPGKNYVSLGDAITFFPCFLLGYGTTRERIDRLRRIPKLLSAGILLCAMVCVVLVPACTSFDFLDLCFFTRYYGFALSSVKYIGIELCRYGIALVMGACVLNLVPETPGFWTRIGKNTLPILLFHSVPHLREALDALNPLPTQPIFCLVWWTFWAVLATVLLGSSTASKLYTRAMSFCRGLMRKACRGAS